MSFNFDRAERVDRPRKPGDVELQWRNKDDEFYTGLDCAWRHYRWARRDEAARFLADEAGNSKFFEYREVPRG